MLFIIKVLQNLHEFKVGRVPAPSPDMHTPEQRKSDAIPKPTMMPMNALPTQIPAGKYFVV
jgi:hypothetical protein